MYWSLINLDGMFFIVKQELINFLEIGKIEKGLFRIWVVISIIFYLFFYSIMFQEDIYKDFRDISKKNYFCLKNSELFKIEDIPPDYYVIGELVGLTTKIEFPRPVKKSSYSTFLSSPALGYDIFKDYDKFKDEKSCKSFINQPKNDFLIAFFLITFFPLSLIFVWFLFKKTYLWIYRGFK